MAGNKFSKIPATYLKQQRQLSSWDLTLHRSPGRQPHERKADALAQFAKLRQQKGEGVTVYTQRARRIESELGEGLTAAVINRTVMNLLDADVKRTVTVANRTKIEGGIPLDFEKTAKKVIISHFEDEENLVEQAGRSGIGQTLPYTNLGEPDGLCNQTVSKSGGGEFSES